MAYPQPVNQCQQKQCRYAAQQVKRRGAPPWRQYRDAKFFDWRNPMAVGVAGVVFEPVVPRRQDGIAQLRDGGLDPTALQSGQAVMETQRIPVLVVKARQR